MAIFRLPEVWDAKKFATRYNLDINRDFYIDGDRNLVVRVELPEEPVFEQPDPVIPRKTIDEEFAEIKARITALEEKHGTLIR